MGNKLILWGVGTKRTIRAHWALHELDLPYECRPIMSRSGETKSTEFTALNVRQKIPLLEDGDFVLEKAQRSSRTWPRVMRGRTIP